MYYGLNRYICDVLAEMRKCHETRNYSILPSLIEECQLMASRMEAALGDKNDLKELQEKISKLKDELRLLQEKKDQLVPPAEDE